MKEAENKEALKCIYVFQSCPAYTHTYKMYKTGHYNSEGGLHIHRHQRIFTVTHTGDVHRYKHRSTFTVHIRVHRLDIIGQHRADIHYIYTVHTYTDLSLYHTYPFPWSQSIYIELIQNNTLHNILRMPHMSTHIILCIIWCIVVRLAPLLVIFRLIFLV